MEVLLDTSFILTCLKQGVDFLEAQEYGILVLPRQVIDELKKLTEKGERKEKEAATLALELIKKNKGKFRIIELKSEFADAGIRKYVEEKDKETGEVSVATLDRGLKKSLRGKIKILTIRAGKKMELV
jgi:rRNA-processing protein FCF1